MVRIRPNSSSSYGCSMTFIAFVAGAAFAVLFQQNSSPYASPLLVGDSVESFSTAAAPEDKEPMKQLSTSSSPDFYKIAKQTGTDKVKAQATLPHCLSDPKQCKWPEAVNPSCRVPGHYYHTMYNQWLPRLQQRSEPFVGLEIGFFNGLGFDAYLEYFKDSPAEMHSMEISCIEPGPRNEGKWPWGNFASKHGRYKEFIEKERLHCGDAADYQFLKKTWETHLKKEDKPLMLVIDDGAHLAQHMATSLFFWMPRIAPGGLMVVEDVEPLGPANGFRQHVLPQVLKDLHYCGREETFKEGQACFPTIQPFIQSVHCEMHICVFERNDKPAHEPSEQDSMPPAHALKASACLFR